MNLLEKYDEWIKFTKMPYNMYVWISLSIATTVLVIIASSFFSTFILKQITLIPVAFGAATLVLMIGYPYMKKESIVDFIEYNFSDALKLMADTLKAGDTYESALREIVNSDYGRLSSEMEIALRRLEEGENIETALRGFSERIDSKLIKRTIIILLDSIKTGASLSEILEEISDDVKATYRLKEERKANTTMQFMFMVAASGFIAPLIFGEITAIMDIFATVTASVMDANTIQTNSIPTFIFLLIQAYLIIQVIASGIMMSIIREGKFNKSIIYIPMLLVIAYISYYTATIMVGVMLAGAF